MPSVEILTLSIIDDAHSLVGRRDVMNGGNELTALVLVETLGRRVDSEICVLISCDSKPS